MKKTLTVLTLLTFSQIFSQTLIEKQMVNARATGYAAIASKNPGLEFSVFVIPWDGVNTLEYNANNQINPGWHPQAAVKAQYFDQPFDGANFTDYSSFVTSEAKFNQFKSTGTQWWIICSNIPSFSSSISSDVNTHNVGIGTDNPLQKLDVRGGAISSQDNTDEGGTLILENTTKTSPNTAKKWTLYNMTGTYGNSLQFWNYSADGAMFASRLKISDEGNMALYGKFEAKEIKVTLTPTADFVFEENYSLPKLEEIEKHIKEKKHLPEIASAKEMEKEGVNVGEFQIKLLQKIEELTLYTIEQNKQLKKVQKDNEKLMLDVENLKKRKTLK
ncbi:hypothetical protein M2347_001950 [Chryseobacterium sp. H1D6B]|uniref:hypothetical protein n=1 Tax=Chryseobacterium sp. H1D6B TaxID=2940588 RepID=UPI0015CB5322|nr:hypothetical protein [Chryseobacterium sp. H1D6B]MDH6252223.1 hypothetical protein [Chryseobacterium sp. H1D6B]